MDHFELPALSAFIVQAKQATYVGSGRKLLSYRLGSHDLQFFAGDWAYHDSYLGECDFMGEEIVYWRKQAVWGMNYFGRILQPEQISAAEAGKVIKKSLSRLYLEGRFLGGWEYQRGDFHYVDTNQGDVTFFTGRETIRRGDAVVYELVYHGGLIN